MNSRKTGAWVATYGMLIGLAFIFSYLEAIIPIPIPIICGFIPIICGFIPIICGFIPIFAAFMSIWGFTPIPVGIPMFVPACPFISV